MSIFSGKDSTVVEPYVQDLESVVKHVKVFLKVYACLCNAVQLFNKSSSLGK